MALGSMATALGALLPLFGTTLPAAIGVIMPFLGPAGLIAAGLIALAVIWMKWGDDIKAFVAAVVEKVVEFGQRVADMAQRVRDTITAMVSMIRDVFVNGMARIAEGVKAQLDRVTGFFANMSDVLVGHSIVPDMVNMIGEEFGRMRGDMETETTAAVAATEASFGEMGGTLLSQAQSAIDGVRGVFKDFGIELPQEVRTLVNTVGVIWDGITSKFSLVGKFDQTLEDWAEFAKNVIDTIQNIWKVVGSVIDKIGKVLNGGQPGGYIDPTRMNGQFGGSGPTPTFGGSQSVMPGGGGGGGGGSGGGDTNINVSVNIGSVLGTAADIAEAIGPEIAAIVNRELGAINARNQRLQGSAVLV
jgi:hypothetical protein